MGMFDRIWFECPKCGSRMEAQSKAGECLLIDYPAIAVPEEIAKDIAGNWVHCIQCDKSYEIGGKQPEKLVSVELI